MTENKLTHHKLTILCKHCPIWLCNLYFLIVQEKSSKSPANFFKPFSKSLVLYEVIAKRSNKHETYMQAISMFHRLITCNPNKLILHRQKLQYSSSTAIEIYYF